MDAIRQSGCAMAVGGMAALVEVCVNEVVSAQADALREEVGIPRNGFGERRLETRVGAITLGTLKLRGGYFPEGIVERWSRIDRVNLNLNLNLPRFHLHFLTPRRRRLSGSSPRTPRG